MDSKPFNSTPFEDIALMMSGGGYRAAAFHLGTMSYLYHVLYKGQSLLEKVRVLSTISGGTFPGVLYAHAVHSDIPFEEFFKSLYRFMDEEDLMELAMEKLADPSVWKGISKNRNLINALTLVYDERLFGESQNRNFDAFYTCESHLEEVIFNSTEFNRGLAFRFQKTLGDRGLIGNYYLKFPLELAKKIRLGDIIAASSCFPAGFEPLSFPQDFLPGDIDKEEAKKWKIADNEVGLMDGGIIDNQGIESVILSENRREEQPDIGKSLDLLIVSDVSGPLMNPLQFSDPEKPTFKRFANKSIVKSKNILIWITIFTLILLVVLILIQTGKISAPVWLSYLLFGIFFSGLIFTLSGWIMKNYLGKILYANVDPYFRKFLPAVGKLPLKVLEPMMKNRFNSVILMVSEVFMKQIRRLVYDKVYEYEKWKDKRISNQIYDLTKVNIQRKIKRTERKNEQRKAKGLPEIDYGDLLKTVPENVSSVAELASSMTTSLWFTAEDRDRDPSKDKLMALLADGQATICMNLMLYICELRADKETYANSDSARDIDAMWEHLQMDWKEFGKDPFWLLRNYI